jgi:hypothetical protein
MGWIYVEYMVRKHKYKKVSEEEKTVVLIKAYLEFYLMFKKRLILLLRQEVMRLTEAYHEALLSDAKTSDKFNYKSFS